MYGSVWEYAMYVWVPIETSHDCSVNPIMYYYKWTPLSTDMYWFFIITSVVIYKM